MGNKREGSGFGFIYKQVKLGMRLDRRKERGGRQGWEGLLAHDILRGFYILIPPRTEDQTTLPPIETRKEKGRSSMYHNDKGHVWDNRGVGK
jgi:hypothetical protein